MAQLAINVGHLAVGIGMGDSVSVNGACLTVNEMEGEILVFYAMPETLRRTALGDLAEGDLANLERAMTPETRFGGQDRKSTRLNSSHANISYAVFCLK